MGLSRNGPLVWNGVFLLNTFLVTGKNSLNAYKNYPMLILLATT